MFGYYNYFGSKDPADLRNCIWVYMIFQFVGAALAAIAFIFIEKRERQIFPQNYEKRPDNINVTNSF